MPADVARRRWTAREVRQLIADAPEPTPRYELIDGDLVVTPSPAPPHQMAVGTVFAALRTYCDSQHVGQPMTSPSDIELEPESVRQPDVFVLPSAEWKRIAKGGFPARELMLAIEVLSPSTALVDRVAKRLLFQRHVPEYWVVDLDERLVERWRPEDTKPEVLTESLTWQPSGVAEPLIIDLRSLFARAWGED